jgi:hypothetical protein
MPAAYGSLRQVAAGLGAAGRPPTVARNHRAAAAKKAFCGT